MAGGTRTHDVRRAGPSGPRPRAAAGCGVAGGSGGDPCRCGLGEDAGHHHPDRLRGALRRARPCPFRRRYLHHQGGRRDVPGDFVGWGCGCAGADVPRGRAAAIALLLAHLRRGRLRNSPRPESSLVAGAASPAVYPDPTSVRDLAAEIEWAKVSQLHPSDYPAAAVAAGRALPTRVDAAAMAAVYAGCETAKDAAGRLDFEDVLLFAIGPVGREPVWARAPPPGSAAHHGGRVPGRLTAATTVARAVARRQPQPVRRRRSFSDDLHLRRRRPETPHRFRLALPGRLGGQDSSAPTAAVRRSPIPPTSSWPEPEAAGASRLPAARRRAGEGGVVPRRARRGRGVAQRSRSFSPTACSPPRSRCSSG